jgi:hypothetical protein
MNKIDLMLDKAHICQLLQDWALWRDVGNWSALRGAYAPNATMRTTWFDGAAADFVDASMRLSQGAAKAQHFIGASSIQVHGERALAETRVILLVRAPLKDVEVDATCYGRFFDRLVKVDGRWLIDSRVPIYEKDHLRAVDPGCKLELDPQELARYPAPYRYLAYLQASGGATITFDLPLPGSPEQAALHEQGNAWLTGDA